MYAAQIDISGLRRHLEKDHPDNETARYAAFQEIVNTGTREQRIVRSQVLTVLNTLEQIAETIDRGYADGDFLEKEFAQIMARYEDWWKFLIDGQRERQQHLSGDDRPWAYMSKIADRGRRRQKTAAAKATSP